MSTTPRLASAVDGQPATFRTVLAQQPAVFEAFWQLYGTFWSHGELDHATKEVARMRNARVTDCGYCKNVRFAEARREGLDEDTVSLIQDGFEGTELTERQKLVVRYTDTLLHHPGELEPELAAELRAVLTPGQITELALGVSLFMGFAKALISMGLEPDQMDTTVVPTPDVPA